MLGVKLGRTNVGLGDALGTRVGVCVETAVNVWGGMRVGETAGVAQATSKKNTNKVSLFIFGSPDKLQSILFVRDE